MGLKQKKAVAKKESGDLKVDKTSKAGYDRSVAEVIKRLKHAKEETNRFDKMGLTKPSSGSRRARRVRGRRARAESAETRVVVGVPRVAPARRVVDDETPTNVSDNLAKASADTRPAGDRVRRGRVVATLAAETQAEPAQTRRRRRAARTGRCSRRWTRGASPRPTKPRQARTCDDVMRDMPHATMSRR